ncbi:hypothetical protein LZC95_20455 [Pendulispora brunnea]|uniref:Uncharacterized protein n=1 Tax=Pendulispora brunnea TaxID=2905690 RepID=A0ABZ2KKI1_9BACT
MTGTGSKAHGAAHLLAQRQAVLDARAAEVLARGALEKVEHEAPVGQPLDRMDAEAMVALASSVVHETLEQYFDASERALGRDPDSDPVTS